MLKPLYTFILLHLSYDSEDVSFPVILLWFWCLIELVELVKLVIFEVWRIVIWNYDWEKAKVLINLTEFETWESQIFCETELSF